MRWELRRKTFEAEIGFGSGRIRVSEDRGKA
jgi:hypothetical protein